MGNINSQIVEAAAEKLYKLAQTSSCDPSTAGRAGFGNIVPDTKGKVNHIKFRGNNHSIKSN